MADRMFTLKDWERMKRDVFDDFFEQHKDYYDAKELEKLEQLGGVPEEEVEGGY